MRNPNATSHDRPEIRPASSHYVGIAFVIAIHVAAIWAIANGLKIHVGTFTPPELMLHVLQPSEPEHAKVLPPPRPVLAKPVVDNTMPKPVIQIQTQPQTQQAISASTQHVQPTPDSAASGIANTHTTPPYPADARRLGQQGTVMLLLSIDATGTVTNAQVKASSGYPELDQTAVTWVIAHWRYKPAVQNGTPVASTAQAAVKFDLKDAR